MKTSIYSIVAVILVASLAMSWGCRRQAETGASAQVPAVRVVKPILKEVTEYAYFTGRMDAVESVDVRARVTGYLDEINFQQGQKVKEGEQLFKIDPRPYQAAADQADSQIALAKAQLVLAKANFNRIKDIAQTPGAVSQQEVDTTAALFEQANAQLKAATAAAEQAKLNLGFTSVKAEIDGIIGRPLLTLGNLIVQDSTLLTTIVSQDPIYAYFDVDEQSLLRYQQLVREGKVKSVRKGEEVPVQLGLADEGNEYPHSGNLDFVNNRLDPTTGTLQLRGVFANPEAADSRTRVFTPGLFVRVRLPIGEAHEAMLIPQAAIGTDQGQKYVLTVNDQDIVEYQPITTGPQEAGELQVVVPEKIASEIDSPSVTLPEEQSKKSLTPQDRIIVGGLQKVRAGDKVNPKLIDSLTPGL